MKKILGLMVMLVSAQAFAGTAPVPAWTCSGYCNDIYLESDGESSGEAFKNLRELCRIGIRQPASSRNVAVSFNDYGTMSEKLLGSEFVRATIQNSCVKN